MGTRPLATGPRTTALARIISLAMEEVGMGRARLEETAEISHNRLAVLLRGERPMTVEELSRICGALGLRPARVMDAVEEAVREVEPLDPPDNPLVLAARTVHERPEHAATHQWDDVGEEPQTTPWDD